MEEISLARAELLSRVVMPALGQAERAFSAALARIEHGAKGFSVRFASARS